MFNYRLDSNTLQAGRNHNRIAGEQDIQVSINPVDLDYPTFTNYIFRWMGKPGYGSEVYEDDLPPVCSNSPSDCDGKESSSSNCNENNQPRLYLKPT